MSYLQYEKGFEMNLLERHRDDYKTLTKKELLLIIEEQLKINKKRIEKNVYSPENSIRNNNRRAFRKYFSKRNESKLYRVKVYEKLEILKGLK